MTSDSEPETASALQPPPSGMTFSELYTIGLTHRADLAASGVPSAALDHLTSRWADDLVRYQGVSSSIGAQLKTRLCGQPDQHALEGEDMPQGQNRQWKAVILPVEGTSVTGNILMAEIVFTADPGSEQSAARQLARKFPGMEVSQVSKFSMGSGPGMR